MDRQIDVEKLRAQLKAMPRARVLELADKASVARSTAEKFRLGHIEELGSFKLERLANAMQAEIAQTLKRRRKPATQLAQSPEARDSFDDTPIDNTSK